MKKTTTSWLLLLACNLMWALQFTCIKLTQDQLGPLSTVLIPITAATIMMVPFVWRDIKSNPNRQYNDLWIFFLLALVGQFPAQALTTFGTQQSTASNATIINLSLPVVSLLLAHLVLKEKLTGLRWLSFTIALTGVALCSYKDLMNLKLTESYAWGNILIFSGVAGSAFYNTYCKKITGLYTETEMLFYTYLFLILLLTPLTINYEGNPFSKFSNFTANTWIGILLLSLFHNFLSMILFFKALKKLEAIQVAFSNFLIPLFGLPIAIFVLDEKLNSLSILGGVMVLVATVLITVWEYRDNRKRIEQ